MPHRQGSALCPRQCGVWRTSSSHIRCQSRTLVFWRQSVSHCQPNCVQQENGYVLSCRVLPCCRDNYELRAWSWAQMGSCKWQVQCALPSGLVRAVEFSEIGFPPSPVSHSPYLQVIRSRTTDDVYYADLLQALSSSNDTCTQAQPISSCHGRRIF